MDDHELVKCPLCDSQELHAIDGRRLTLSLSDGHEVEMACMCHDCGSIFTQRGIDALAGVEHPDPGSPLDELSELSR